MTLFFYFNRYCIWIFSALIAYLINYKKWIHHYSNIKKSKKIALKIAIFSFIIFLLIVIISGYISIFHF